MTKQITAMTALAAVIMLGVVSSASAVLLMDESFDYAAGSLESVSGGAWVIASGDKTTTLVDTAVNLTYPGYDDGGGGSGTFVGNSNAPAQRPVDGLLSQVDNNAGTYYASVLIKGNVDWWARLGGIWVVQHQPSENANTLYGNADPPHGSVAGGRVNTGVPLASGPDGVDLLVAKIVQNGVGSNDTLQMVVNPDLSQGIGALETALSNAQAHDTRDTSNGDGTIFTQFSRAPTGGQVWFDEMRWATNLGEVIPEPASMTLLALGGLVMLRRRR